MPIKRSASYRGRAILRRVNTRSPVAMLTVGLVGGLLGHSLTTACRPADPEPELSVVTPAPVAAPAPAVVEVTPAPTQREAPEMPAQVQVREVSRRMNRDTLGALLSRADVSGDVAANAVAAMRPVLDARRMRPSDFVTVRLENGALARITIQRDRDDGVPETITVQSDGQGGFTARTEAPEVRVEVAKLSGTVQSTLYESMVAAGEMPSLINQFVDVFASQVDFYREVQNGDGFRALVEKRYAGDKFVGYGRVLAAEYKQGWRTLRGFHHKSQDGSAGHFDEKGRSLLTAFLKTPMEFTRITSKFGMRFHPILKERKAHNGVDYGAPTGTPVWSVADGRVVTASYEGACGNAVMIQHSNGILTGYCHLSRFAAGLKAGARVSQKQVVGYVGTTGRSTAPHLHFLMKRNGHYVNPQRMEAPRKPGLTGDELTRFTQSIQQLAHELDAIPAA
ncbi:MAG: M23 family metallopeptidase [Myxococcota bacterium]